MTECRQNLFLYLSILGILFEASLRFILSACPSSYNAPVALFISYLLSIMYIVSFDNFFFQLTMYHIYTTLCPLWISLDHKYLCVVGIGHYMAVYVLYMAHYTVITLLITGNITDCPLSNFWPFSSSSHFLHFMEFEIGDPTLKT